MRLLFVIILIFFSINCFSQSKSDLETQRTKTLEEIQYVDSILKTTAAEKSQNLNVLRVLNNKVSLRENVVKGLNDEIELLNTRLNNNILAIEMMENDILYLKQDYKNAIINAYKSKKLYPDIVYLFSAKDFNQGYKRLNYLKQISKFRRSETEIVYDLMEEIEKVKAQLNEDLAAISKLKDNEVNQAVLLRVEQENKQKLVSNLSKRERQLQKQLDDKKKLAQQIEKEIAKVIAEEKKRASHSELTPEQTIIGNNFADNKGRLPWPVEKGILTSQFGKHQHPVFKSLIEDNIGIEITSSGKTPVRSVFKGEVSAITAISGSNMTIIVRHGKYLSVYNNIINVQVKKGDQVETKQKLGDVFLDPDSNSSVLKFMIFDEQKYLDPQLWISK